MTISHLRRQRGGIEHFLLIVFLQARTRLMQPVEHRRDRRRIAEEVPPELDAHLVAEIGDFLELTGIALGDAEQLSGGQGDKFMFWQREFAKTQRRTHTERAPVRGAAVERRRQRELLFKCPGEGLLGVETVLKRNIKDWTGG